ncbi:ROK family protein [Paenibacillus senegalensis]|uniref:ROK family protein n=1 Tax=Paenibacillus senegalensis TaxID=1465766 RepID=UPI000287A49C|nr:ROK family protein [Paenibacillus senegalensis]
MTTTLLGAVEAGGTKFVCGVGTADGKVLDRTQFPTTTPEETIQQVEAYFAKHEIQALGVGSFGPIDPVKNSPTYGYITSTPKQQWGDYNFLGRLKQSFQVPIGFDTDVNVAALGEWTFGAAQGTDSCVYITIGTGFGGGAVIAGELLHGLSHPEMGHMLVRRHPQDSFAGLCPFHGDCLEGLASGPALQQRWGKPANELPKDSIAWDIEAYYLAQSLAAIILILSPQKIILGGGVMKQEQLFPLIHKQLQQLLNGYVRHEAILKSPEHYIVPPGLGDNAGLCGALALAQQTLLQSN